MKENQYIGATAALYGGVLYVSPAMYSLMESAEDSDELERLCEKIRVAIIPGDDAFTMPVRRAAGLPAAGEE